MDYTVTDRIVAAAVQDVAVACPLASALIVYGMSLEPTLPVDVRDIALVGELTTEEGPMLDDHFLVLVLWNGSVSTWEGNSPEAKLLLSALNKKWGVEMAYRIIGRTDFASRVMFPLELQESPLFFARERSGWKALWERIKMFGVITDDLFLTPELTRYLAEHHSSRL